MKHYSGVWPVAPTIFHNDGSLDLEGCKNALDCIIAQGADGICILANFSEQFLLSDVERDILMRSSIEHIAGKLPVIVTISHFATCIAVERATAAKALGADCVMMMPPYHGAVLKGNDEQIFDHFAAVGTVGIPIMIQDAPLSGVDLPAKLLVRMAREIEMLQMFKIECIGAASKIREIVAKVGDAALSPFDGEEGITLMADLDAGSIGSMTSALIPDLIRPIIAAHQSGKRADAAMAYAKVLPTMNFENRQCGFRAAKEAMLEGGVIRSAFCRHPIQPLHPETRTQLIELIRPLKPVVLEFNSCPR